MKKQAILGIVAMAAALMVSTSASAAPAQTATYVTGGTVAAAGASAGSQTTVAAAGVGRGGYTFAVSTKPLTLRIEDEASGAASMGYTACQVLQDLPTACGQAGTVTQVGCTPATGTVTLNAGFVSGKAFTVFVHAINGDCEGIATAGIIKVTYS